MANRNLLIDIGENTQLDPAFLGTGLTISNSGKLLTMGAAATTSLSRSQRPKLSGKLFFGAKVVSGYVAIGIGTQFATATNTYPGAVTDSWGVYCNNPGTAKWGYWNHGPGVDVAASAVGDWLFVAVDLANGALYLGHAPAATPTVITWAGGNTPGVNTGLFTDLNSQGTFVANQVRKFYLMAAAFATNGASVQIVTDYQNLATTLPSGYTPWGEIAFLSARGAVTIPNDTQYPAGGMLPRYYDARIRADGDPEYTRTAQVWPWGAVSKPTLPIAQIEFENGDGGLDFMLPMNLRDVPITGWLYNLGATGTDTMPDSSTWIRAFTMIGDHAENVNEQDLRVVIKDKLSFVDKPVQANVYPTSTPNTALWNTPVPFGLGYCTYAPVTVWDAANLEFDYGYAVGQISEVRDQGVVISGGSGWAASRYAGEDGFCRLVNPAGKQVATLNMQSVQTAQQVNEPFSAFSGGAPGSYFYTGNANTSLTNPSGTVAQLNCTTATPANNQATLQPAYAPGSGTYVYLEVVVSAVTSGKAEIVAEPTTNAVTGGSTSVVAIIDRPGTYKFSFVKSTANRVFGIQWGKTTCNIQITGAAIYSQTTTDTLAQWATELFINRGGLLVGDIDSGGTISTLSSIGYTLCWFQQAQNGNILDIFQAALDSFTGSYWQDRNGLIKVGRLVDPSGLSGSSVATFDSSNIFGDVTPSDDFAQGLSASMAGVPNWSPHAPTDIAGSVLNTAAGAILQAPYITTAKSTTALDAFYQQAMTRNPQPTVLSVASFVSTEMNRVGGIYATRRRFWAFQAFLTDAQSYTIEPYNIILLAITDRYGITSSIPLLVVTATSRFLSDLVSIQAWG